MALDALATPKHVKDVLLRSIASMLVKILLLRVFVLFGSLCFIVALIQVEVGDHVILQVIVVPKANKQGNQAYQHALHASNV